MWPIVLSFLFLISFELLVAKPLWLLGIFSCLFLITLLSLVKNKKISIFNSLNGFPLVFLIGNFLFFPLLIGQIWQHSYIILTSLIFYLTLVKGPYQKEREEILKSIDKPDSSAKNFFVFLTAFLCFGGIYGLYLNLLFPLWLMIAAVLLITFLLTYQFLTPHRSQPSFWLYLFILALIMVEMAWTLSFLPFSYLTIGAILLIIYYVILNLLELSLNKSLSKSLILKRIFLAIIALILLLITTKWLPINY